MSPTLRIPSPHPDADHHLLMQHLLTGPEVFIDARSARKGRLAGGKMRGEQLSQKAETEWRTHEALKRKLQRRADQSDSPRPTDAVVALKYLTATKQRQRVWGELQADEQKAEICRHVARVRKTRQRKSSA